MKADSKLFSTALGKAAEAALEVLQTAPNVANKASFWKWQRQNEILLEQLGDVYFLYMSKLFTAQVALTLFEEFGAVLRWQEEFHAKYPHFALWTLLIAEKQSLKILQVRFEQQEQVVKTFTEISQIMRQRDSFWTENSTTDEQYSHQISGDLDLISRSSVTDKNNTAFKAENMREEWFSEWIHTGYLATAESQRGFTINLAPQLSPGPDPYMKTLLRWLKYATSEHEVSTADLELLLVPPESGGSQGNIDGSVMIQQLTPTTLQLHLYGPYANPVSSTTWQKKFAILQGWLLYKARYHETKRHVLLERLQMQILNIMIPTSRYEDILCEAERMLDLIPTLCEEAQQSR